MEVVHPRLLRAGCLQRSVFRPRPAWRTKMPPRGSFVFVQGPSVVRAFPAWLALQLFEAPDVQIRGVIARS